MIDSYFNVLDSLIEYFIEIILCLEFNNPWCIIPPHILRREGVRSMKSDKPVAALIGANGNIFNLMAIDHRALLDNGQLEEAEAMVLAVNKAINYHEALEIIGRYVGFGEVAGNE